MIHLLAAALATQSPATLPAENAKSFQCEKDQGVAQSVCLALAAQRTGRFAEAASQFEQVAAGLAEADPKRDRALAAAGNMWIAADEPGKAALALDRALAGAGLQAEERGEALLDRARAAEAQNDLKTARVKANEAAKTIGDQPFFLYFSAALAIREGDAAQAKAAINRALSLAPGDPLIVFEAGHVAHFEGNTEAARAFWKRAAELDPSGSTGKAARDALALLDPAAAVQKGAQTSR